MTKEEILNIVRKGENKRKEVTQMSMKTLTVTIPEDLYENLKTHLIDSGRCENLSDAIQLGIRCFLDEYFNYPDEPPGLDGPSKFMYHSLFLRLSAMKFNAI